MFLKNKSHVHLSIGETKRMRRRAKAKQHSSNSDHFSSDRLHFTSAFLRLTCFDQCPTPYFFPIVVAEPFSCVIRGVAEEVVASASSSGFCSSRRDAQKPPKLFFFFFGVSSSNFSTAATRIDRPPGSADSPQAAGAPKCQPGHQLTS